jgi:hypothetical protein
MKPWKYRRGHYILIFIRSGPLEDYADVRRTSTEEEEEEEERTSEADSL